MLDDTLQKKQESLRQRMLGSKRQWQFIQESMEWAAAQPGAPGSLLQHEARLLAGLT